MFKFIQIFNDQKRFYGRPTGLTFCFPEAVLGFGSTANEFLNSEVKLVVVILICR